MVVVKVKFLSGMVKVGLTEKRLRGKLERGEELVMQVSEESVLGRRNSQSKGPKYS